MTKVLSEEGKITKRKEENQVYLVDSSSNNFLIGNIYAFFYYIMLCALVVICFL